MRALVDLKSTVNLPKTAFPMKANLGQSEAEIAGALGKGQNL